MAISKAQIKATAKYQKANYDDIKLRVSKGDREVIKAYAESLGKSLNAYINDLIRADMGDALPAPAPSEPAAETTE